MQCRRSISRGGLTVPSYDWLNTCAKLDKVFVKHHDVDVKGQFKINQARGARRGLSNKMHSMFPDVPLEAIRLFVRTRCNIRIKHINQQINAGRMRKKKAAQFVKSTMRLRSQETNDEWSILDRGAVDEAREEEAELARMQNLSFDFN